MGDGSGFRSAAWFDKYRRRFLSGATEHELDQCKAAESALPKSSTNERSRGVFLAAVTAALAIGAIFLNFGDNRFSSWIPNWVACSPVILVPLFLILSLSYLSDPNKNLYNVERCEQLRRKLEEERAVQQNHEKAERQRKADRERAEREKTERERAERERKEREEAERERAEQERRERERARTRQSDAGTDDSQPSEADRQRLIEQLEMSLRILGMPRHPRSFAEIETAYRRAIRANHPDKNANDEYATERFKVIREAYDFLSEFRDAFDST